MEATISPKEGLVCLTCGDEGYINAFVYCVKCLGCVVHRYCLSVIPETPDEFVSWSCDDCEPPSPYRFSSPSKHEPSYEPSNSSLEKTKKIASSEDNACVSGPTKRLNRDVVLGLKRPDPKSLQLQKNVTKSLQHVKTQNKCVETTPSNSLPNEALVTSDSLANQITPESAELDTCYPMKGIVKRKRDTIRVPAKKKKHITEKLTEHSSCESSCTDNALKNEEDAANTEKELKSGPDDEKLVYVSLTAEEELNKRNEELNVGVNVSESNNLENDVNYIRDEPARPVLDPVWRGSFQIVETDYDIFEGFVGHLSTIACPKVWHEAITLPSMLTLEMDSKAHIWPKNFTDSMPSHEHIALFFFPGDPKIERDFEQLVSDMLDDDLAMKATSKNAELLIFTSKVLPKAYWRFQDKIYLWGVFRGKKDDVPVSDHNDINSLSEKSGSKVTCEKEIIDRVKTVESHSPQSPLCSYRN